jgi:hypothetical protein
MIDALPPPPSRTEQDREVFVVTTDNFLAALPAWTSQVNSTAEDVDAAKVAAEAARDTTQAISDAAADYVTDAEGFRNEAETFRDEAQTAQAATEAARDATLAAYDSFDDRYLGSKTSDPATDNDGNALAAGMLYYNTVALEMRLYNGSAWVAAYVSSGAYLAKASNLSDLANASTALTNLGGTTVGKAIFTLANPSAISFLRVNADNSVTARSASDMRTDLAVLALSGGTMTGLLTLAADIGLVLTPGNAPGAPADGQLWRTASALQARFSSTTYTVAFTTGAQSLSGKTLVMPTIDGIAVEDTYSITDGAAFSVDPANGGVQRVTLGANRTPTLTSITAGRWVLLLVDDGTAYTLTLSGVTWMSNTGSAPTLKTSGYTAILLMHTGDGLKAWLCGDKG